MEHNKNKKKECMGEFRCCFDWSIIMYLSGQDFMLMHGGRTQQARVLGDTYLLNVRTGHWTQVVNFNKKYS